MTTDERSDAESLQTLFQLHWQNPNNFRETEFVGQGGGSFEEVETWLNDLITRRRSECPEGWVPLVCSEDSEYFVWAAVPPCDRPESP